MPPALAPDMLALDARPALPPLRLAPEVALRRGRAHEATGPSRRLFALLAAAALAGPVLWLHPRWWPERLMADGVRRLVEPGRLLIGRGQGALDILWSAEEALRGGGVPLVVAELPAPPGLTPVRRLHLAAGAGGAVGAGLGGAGLGGAGAGGSGAVGSGAVGSGGAPPLCLLLTPEAGGAPGVETRWHLAPRPGWSLDGRPRWHLVRSRARGMPAAAWEMRLEGTRPVCRVTPGTDPDGASPEDVAGEDDLPGNLRRTDPEGRNARRPRALLRQGGGRCAPVPAVPEETEMPAKSKAQQKAAGAALSAKRGATEKSDLKGASRSMADSMSEEQLRDMAGTERKGKPEHISKS